MTPYRDHQGQLDLPSQGDRDVLVPLALLWLASAVQVVAALLGHARFGAEETLALFFAVTLPCLWIAQAIKNP